MKSSVFKIFPVLAAVLLLVGCSGMPGAGGDAEGTDLAGAAGETYGTDGAQTGIAAAGGVSEESEISAIQHLLDTLTVYFDYDSSEISPQYRDVVIAHGEYLARNADVTVTVEGHCDERGSREYNIALGERRANTVKQLLMAQGAAERQVVTISYGEERPSVEGSDEMVWSKNRRAEMVY